MSLHDDSTPDGFEESGFKRMSQIADAQRDVDADDDGPAAQVGHRIGAIHQMIEDEVRLRPLRALAWAAATGLLVGLAAAR